jgi:hypothetical protein
MLDMVSWIMGSTTKTPIMGPIHHMHPAITTATVSTYRLRLRQSPGST